ncbi:MAG: MliC family protein [Saprospiraceae bacterium]
MTKKILSLTLLTALFFTSCKEGTKTDKAEKLTTQDTVAKTSDEIVNKTSTDKEGKKLEMTFNNTKDIVTLKFNGETIELLGQKPASGILYKNENYELSGKGDDIELTKNGKIIFVTKSDNIITLENQNNEDKIANMKQNNKTDMPTWWVGKHFENNRPLSKNPEEGGPDFLTINQDKTATYKVGDIVEDMTWKVNGTSLTFKSKSTAREVIFIIDDSYLMDSYGTKWTVKK